MNAWASLRFRQRAICSSAARRSDANAAHEFQPADNLPCVRCRSVLDMLSLFCCTIACSLWAARQLVNDWASLRFAKKIKQR